MTDTLLETRTGPTDAEPLEDLLAAVARGDGLAFTRLHARTHPALLGRVVAVLRDHAQSEEVAQEVYLEVWQKAHRFDGARSTAWSWLQMLARRRAIDRVRWSQARRDRDLRVGIGWFEPDRDRSAEHGEAAFERRRLTAALARLSVVQRQALELTYLGELTQSEAAAQLQIPLGTVKSRVRDALLHMRADLQTTG